MSFGIDNPSAPGALQSLTAAQSALSGSERRLTTGRKVDSAKDDGAAFAISRHVETQLTEQDVLRQNQLRMKSVLDVTQAAVSNISDILTELREKAASLNDDSLSADARQAIQNDMDGLVKQVDSAARNASFNGTALLDPPLVGQSVWGRPYAGIINYGTSYATYDTGTTAGTFDFHLELYNVTSTDVQIGWGDGSTYHAVNSYGSPYTWTGSITHHYDESASSRIVTYNITANGPGSPNGFHIPVLKYTPAPEKKQALVYPGGGTMDVQQTGMTAQWLGIDSLGSLTPTEALSAVDSALKTVDAGGEYYGSRQQTVDGLLKQNSQISDSLTAADGRLLDADMSKESAAWQADQTRVSLAATALNVANQSSKMLLSLFNA